jgi:thiol-disulfide isomerase/thioredoxin
MLASPPLRRRMAAVFLLTLALAPVARAERMPALTGATAWFNSKPLTAADLRGKVVLVDFWTYSCINCIRTLPAMRAWKERYQDAGLVIVGVHTPEFPFEADPSKVERAVRRFGITYPVALDANHAIWSAFHNQYWPAHYLVDATGRIRFTHFGEGKEAEEEREIEKLLAERNSHAAPRPNVRMSATATEQPANFADVQSPETYIGHARAERFASPGGLAVDHARAYRAPNHLALNEWAMSGQWRVLAQWAVLEAPHGSILFRFHARDLHLVLGPGTSGKPARFRVRIDGHAPDADHGADIDAEGNGTITEDRLYQLIRLRGPVRDHSFEIEFLDTGVQAFSFTFG